MVVPPAVSIDPHGVGSHRVGRQGSGPSVPPERRVGTKVALTYDNRGLAVGDPPLYSPIAQPKCSRADLHSESTINSMTFRG